MKYFEKYSSNTCASSANQHIFSMAEDEIKTGRIFYKITHSGTYNYSLLFSNILDSTYGYGDISHKNMICSPWKIHEAKIGKCSKDAIPDNFVATDIATQVNNQVHDLKQITFGGNISKVVAPGEFFSSDEIELGFEENEYLCFQLTFSGTVLPYHEETLLPVYQKTENGWIYSNQMPFPGMIGCDRAVNSRIAFIGDSITQGIGAKPNSYAHWNAVLSEMLGQNNAYWNLGIGFARADDMATDSAWSYKAKHNDTVIVCFGVNDILRGFTEEQLIKNLEKIADIFLSAGLKVILQTIPPFDYVEDKRCLWINANNFIRNELSKKVTLVFDVVPFLQQDDLHPYNAKYGGHPNELGCKVWAEGLYEQINKIINIP